MEHVLTTNLLTEDLPLAELKVLKTLLFLIALLLGLMYLFDAFELGGLGLWIRIRIVEIFRVS